MRLLLVEDDQMIGESLQKALTKPEMLVDWAKNGEEAEAAIAIHPFDLILLDLGLPQKTGLELLTGWRQNNVTTPVLILTAQDQVGQRVIGLDAGADDYLVKPFALEELEARIRALTRRKAPLQETTIIRGDAILDTLTKQLTFRNTTAVLTAKEFLIVSALMARNDLVLSKQELEAKLYDWNTEISSNTVEVHVHQLRKRFGANVISNIRGLGYKMNSK